MFPTDEFAKNCGYIFCIKTCISHALCEICFSEITVLYNSKVNQKILLQQFCSCFLFNFEDNICLLFLNCSQESWSNKFWMEKSVLRFGVCPRVKIWVWYFLYNYLSISLAFIVVVLFRHWPLAWHFWLLYGSGKRKFSFFQIIFK